jgi:hypothetical protein
MEFFAGLKCGGKGLEFFWGYGRVGGPEKKGNGR